MSRRQPEGPPPPPIVQRIRLRYAKRGRMRFSSHRDFARAFERSLRRANIPMAYSAGFHPHPKISYVGAAPTGVGSEAEYLEIALAERCDPEAVRAALDSVLPDGLDMVSARDIADCPPGSLADQIQASWWRLEFTGGADGVGAADAPVGESLSNAVEALLAEESVLVDRLTKDGKRSIDARSAIVWASVSAPKTLGSTELSEAASRVTDGGIANPSGPGGASDYAANVTNSAATGRGNDGGRAILDMVVRQVTPAVRPDDVLTALQSVAGFAQSQPPRATRLAQGPIDDAGVVGDPLGSTQLLNNETPVGNR